MRNRKLKILQVFFLSSSLFLVVDKFLLFRHSCNCGIVNLNTFMLLLTSFVFLWTFVICASHKIKSGKRWLHSLYAIGLSFFHLFPEIIPSVYPLIFRLLPGKRYRYDYLNLICESKCNTFGLDHFLGYIIRNASGNF